jgi:oligo-alginate lyase
MTRLAPIRIVLISLICVSGAVAAPPPQPPLFAAEVKRSERFVGEMMAAGVNVPLPKDPGGGYTHEQHKRNYRAVAEAGELFRLTGDKRYAGFVRDLLVAYADMYPGLGPHPARSNQHYGRLFWQILNDAVWLVNSVQGYAHVRATLNEADRLHIDNNLFRKAATFLSVESVATFDRIHNHATWATAGVGMTGYLLGDRDMVERALTGSKKDGKAGFLRQVDQLFSPDGYYAEGPYYQRYALLPFMVFADAIEQNDPGRKIFARRDGVLIKALNTAIQLTYKGYFFPFNDAMKDKSLNTEELYQGVAIGYARTRNPELLSVARYQNQVALSDHGRLVASDLDAGMAKSFAFRSLLLSDGPEGKDGAVAVLRHGDSETGQAVVAKNSSQGMGHGHFDKLSFQYYDNGREVVTDYGAARFLNIESKHGGRYLPENETWAKQTIAHNTLVVDGKSHFDNDEKRADKLSPTQVHYAAGPDFSVSVGTIDGAYPGVAMARALALVTIKGLERPVVVDLLRVRSQTPHRYDLPLHYAGHITRVGAKLKSNVTGRPVLGTENGFQHIWVDAEAEPEPGKAFVTWQLSDRFYTWRWQPTAGARVLLAEIGANDPEFNLRREPIIIQRVEGAGDALFAGVLESHGRYDGAAEVTVASDSRIRSVTTTTVGGADVAVIETLAGERVAVTLAHDPDPKKAHEVMIAGERLSWTGPAARIELKRAGK